MLLVVSNVKGLFVKLIAEVHLALLENVCCRGQCSYRTILTISVSMVIRSIFSRALAGLIYAQVVVESSFEVRRHVCRS